MQSTRRFTFLAWAGSHELGGVACCYLLFFWKGEVFERGLILGNLNGFRFTIVSPGA